MALLDDLGFYLQTEGLGVLGTTLFLGGLPVDAPNVAPLDAITALVETPGFPAEYTHDSSGASVENPVIQTLTRGAPYDYAGARQWAQDIFVALGQIQNQVLSGTYYFWALPWQSVFRLHVDDFGRPVFSCQFRIGKAI